MTTPTNNTIGRRTEFLDQLKADAAKHATEPANVVRLDERRTR